MDKKELEKFYNEYSINKIIIIMFFVVIIILLLVVTFISTNRINNLSDKYHYLTEINHSDFVIKDNLITELGLIKECVEYKNITKYNVIDDDICNTYTLKSYYDDIELQIIKNLSFNQLDHLINVLVYPIMLYNSLDKSYFEWFPDGYNESCLALHDYPYLEKWNETECVKYGYFEYSGLNG